MRSPPALLVLLLVLHAVLGVKRPRADTAGLESLWKSTECLDGLEEVKEEPEIRAKSGGWYAMGPQGIFYLYQKLILGVFKTVLEGVGSVHPCTFTCSKDGKVSLNQRQRIRLLDFYNNEFMAVEESGVVHLKFKIDLEIATAFDCGLQEEAAGAAEEDDGSETEYQGAIRLENTDVDLDLAIQRKVPGRVRIVFKNVFIEAPDVGFDMVTMKGTDPLDETINVIKESLKLNIPEYIINMLTYSESIINSLIAALMQLCEDQGMGLTYDDRMTSKNFKVTFNSMSIPFSFLPRPYKDFEEEVPTIGKCHELFDYKEDSRKEFSPSLELDSMFSSYISGETYSMLYDVFRESGKFDCDISYTGFMCNGVNVSEENINPYYLSSMFWNFYNGALNEYGELSEQIQISDILYSSFKTNITNTNVIFSDECLFNGESVEGFTNTPCLIVYLNGKLTIVNHLLNSDSNERSTSWNYSAVFAHTPSISFVEQPRILTNLNKFIHASLEGEDEASSLCNALPPEIISAFTEKVYMPIFNKSVENGLYYVPIFDMEKQGVPWETRRGGEESDISQLVKELLFGLTETSTTYSVRLAPLGAGRYAVVFKADFT